MVNCPVCKRHFNDKHGLMNHITVHKKFVKKQKDIVAYYIAHGYNGKYIIDRPEIIFSAHWLKKRKHDDEYLSLMVNKYLDEIKKDIADLFLNNYSVKDIKEKYIHLSLNSIRDYIKEKIGQETFNNIFKKNRNKKISVSVSEFNLHRQKMRMKHTAICPVCGNSFEYYTFRKCCSKECLHKRLVAGGKKSATRQNKRSKNEKYFAELCINYFKDVSCNEPIFNGWDADVIINDYKIAVLWNGVWHYKKITKKHSVKQVKNRDTIKIQEIRKYGYKEYIIKDLGSFDKKFVESQFEIFIHEFLHL